MVLRRSSPIQVKRILLKIRSNVITPPEEANPISTPPLFFYPDAHQPSSIINSSDFQPTPLTNPLLPLMSLEPKLNLRLETNRLNNSITVEREFLNQSPDKPALNEIVSKFFKTKTQRLKIIEKLESITEQSSIKYNELMSNISSSSRLTPDSKMQFLFELQTANLFEFEHQSATSITIKIHSSLHIPNRDSSDVE